MDHNTIDRELGWDDEIEKDASDWELLPAGDYDFTVTGFERGRHPGSAKLPACNKATVNIYIEAPNGASTTIKHNLFLHTKTEGMLSAFFCAIGQKKKGERLPRMDWQKVIGAKGRCKVGVRDWTNKEGEARQSNEIKKFYAPEDNQMVAPPPASAPPAVPSGGVFTPGKF